MLTADTELLFLLYVKLISFLNISYVYIYIYISVLSIWGNYHVMLLHISLTQHASDTDIWKKPVWINTKISVSLELVSKWI